MIVFVTVVALCFIVAFEMALRRDRKEEMDRVDDDG